MNDKVSKFITALVLYFPLRHESEATEKEWLSAMARTLRDYDGGTLAKAASAIIETRKDRRFPLPSECREACMKILEREKSEKLIGQLPLERAYPEFSQHREKLADDLVMGELGQRAAREGWISALHQFCRKTMRLPEGADINRCINDARGFDRALDQARGGGCGPFSRHIADLGVSMLQRRQDLTDMVLNGVCR